ncbi:MAG: DNA-binding response regulator [Crocinitomicaceae bacterium]|nr:DNA-binding response regulator [Crocinitomicaceae bacterium]
MKALIIDDERLARKELINLLKKHPEITVVGESENVEDAKEKINLLHPDLLFLDVEMPEKTGFDLLNEIETSAQVVFVTAYEDHAISAFDVNAFDYLTKPVLPERLSETVKNLFQEKKELNSLISNRKILELNDHIFIKDGEKCWFLKMEEVVVFESEGNYVRIYFRNVKPLVLMSLNNLESRLSSNCFFRANRRFIVNLHCIKTIENWFNGGLKISLSNDMEVEISRRQAVKFKTRFSL